MEKNSITVNNIDVLGIVDTTMDNLAAAGKSLGKVYILGALASLRTMGVVAKRTAQRMEKEKTEEMTNLLLCSEQEVEENFSPSSARPKKKATKKKVARKKKSNGANHDNVVSL